VEPLAKLYPLLSGGWMVVSRDGAVDGSAGASRHLVTEATSGSGRALDLQLFEGALGWDAAFVKGVLQRALAGVSAAPP
jgi:hypothetical protein